MSTGSLQEAKEKAKNFATREFRDVFGKQKDSTDDNKNKQGWFKKILKNEGLKDNASL